ncbi:hypothetical protein [Bradyrhizobium sp. BR 1432]|uniref:hypothetical protein n=1 Tax=Bradyrhizobium sp. BR 1432 TaxID=3447966 RepID=UPI003EE4DF70
MTVIDHRHLPDHSRSGTARPDLVDAFIVLLIATALDIFVFSMATQFISSPAFQKLPSFIMDTYSAIWTSVASGVTGVGLALVKAINRKPGQHAPNYLLYILATAFGLIAAIVLLAFISLRMAPVPTATAAPLPVVDYKVCSGEYERNCPQAHDMYQYCGFDTKAWSAQHCTSSTVVRLDTRSGNKCGYSTDKVICTGPK